MVLIFLAVALVYGLTMGRNRLVAVMLASYLSFLLTKAIPWGGLGFLGIKQPPPANVQIFIFLAIILGFYFLIPRSAWGSIWHLRGRSHGSWWQILTLSVLQIGLTLELVITFLPSKAVASFSPLAQRILLGSTTHFFWLLLPILAVLFLHQRRHYDMRE